MLNEIVIHGRLTADPTIKQTASGVNVCYMTVAVDRTYAKQGEEKITDFFTVNAWRKLAENASRHLSKGSEVIVFGAMHSRKWTDKNNENRISWEISASDIDFCGSKTENKPDMTNSIQKTETTHTEKEDALPF